MAIDTMYGQLTPNVIATLEVPSRGCRHLEVLLRYESQDDSFAPIYMRYEATLDRCPDPVIEGRKSEYVGIALGVQLPAPMNTQSFIIKLVSAGASKYAIRVW